MSAIAAALPQAGFTAVEPSAGMLEMARHKATADDLDRVQSIDDLAPGLSADAGLVFDW